MLYMNGCSLDLYLCKETQYEQGGTSALAVSSSVWNRPLAPASLDAFRRNSLGENQVGRRLDFFSLEK